MNHPGDGTLQALLDGEIAQDDGLALEQHLHGCDRCRGEMEALRAAAHEVTGALRLLDRPAPVRTAHRELARRRVRTVWGMPLGRAAVLLIGLGTALSASIPGSPLRGWITDAWRANDAAQMHPEAAPREVAAPSVAARPVVAGVSLHGTREAVRVVLLRPAPGLRVVARLHEGEQVNVSASGPAAGARFRTGPDRIEITDADTGEVSIEIPRAASRFWLEVDGRVLLSKQGANLRVPERATNRGPEILLEVQR